jgi:uncharacterized membrane protein (DUF485 family)
MKGRTILAGLAGGAAMNLTMFLTFRLLGLGLTGGGILLDPALQSHKLIAVWTELRPIPKVVTHPFLMGIAVLLIAWGHAGIYRWLAPAWPHGVGARAFRFASLVFFLSFFFFEFFTAFNQFGEPLDLLALQLVYWAIVAAAEAWAIAAVIEWKPRAVAL